MPHKKVDRSGKKKLDRTNLDDIAKMLMIEFPNRPTNPCATGESKNLPLIVALRDRGATFATVSRILRDRYNEKIDPQGIARHCRQICRCPR